LPLLRAYGIRVIIGVNDKQWPYKEQKLI